MCLSRSSLVTKGGGAARRNTQWCHLIIYTMGCHIKLKFINKEVLLVERFNKIHYCMVSCDTVKHPGSAPGYAAS
jgi:hypothetical protein